MYRSILRVLLLLPCAFSEPKIFSLWRDFPNILMLNGSAVQPACKNAVESLINRIDRNDINAMKMLDASAKIPSGILSGNLNQYGDFDECMGLENGQYCLVEIDPGNFWKQPFSKFKDLAHSYFFFTETFDDPAHRLPGFSMIKWGICIPEECSSRDLENSLSENFGWSAHVRPGICQKGVKKGQPYSVGDYISRAFFMTVIAAVVVGTVFDYLSDLLQDKNALNRSQKGKLEELLLCFSLKKNWAKLCEVKENPEEISCLHGIRCVSAFGLLMSHKSVALFFNPYINRTATIERLTAPWTIIAKNAILYTDCFILLSGLLNANALFSSLSKSQSMNFKEKLINRIFRILPNFLAIILFCTYILPSIGSGPLWPVIIDHHSELCKHYMWRNFLFIHNYFGFEKMCLTHTHQLGIDMQLFLVTPILVFAIWKSRRRGMHLLFFLALASTVLRFWVTYANELSTVVYFGISIKKMFSVADLSYIMPTHRATVYIMGIFMAYFLKFTKPRTFSNTQLGLLWSFFLVLFLGTWWGPHHMVNRFYVYNRLEASLIATFSPVFWGSGVCFGIYAFHRNLPSAFLGKFFSWKYFQIGTRIAYALYLVQFPMFFYNVGLTKHVDEYQRYYQLQLQETIFILLASVILVLLIEMPFQNLKSILFNVKKQTVIQPIVQRKSKTG